MRGLEVRPEAVGEAQHRHGDVLVALREAADGVLGLDDVRLQPRARRVRALHRLGEEGRVVALAAVVVRGGLEDDLAHGRVRPAAGREDVHRPDHVDLVRVARGGLDRVHDQPRVDHRVDLRRLHDPPQQRVLRADADELRALELERRVVRADADDRLDAVVALERLRELAAPEGRDARDEDARLIRTRRSGGGRACRSAPPGCARGSRRRPSGSARGPARARRPTGRSGRARGSGS